MLRTGVGSHHLDDQPPSLAAGCLMGSEVVVKVLEDPGNASRLRLGVWYAALSGPMGGSGWHGRPAGVEVCACACVERIKSVVVL